MRCEKLLLMFVGREWNALHVYRSEWYIIWYEYIFACLPPFHRGRVNDMWLKWFRKRRKKRKSSYKIQFTVGLNLFARDSRVISCKIQICLPRSLMALFHAIQLTKAEQSFLLGLIKCFIWSIFQFTQWLVPWGVYEVCHYEKGGDYFKFY